MPVPRTASIIEIDSSPEPAPLHVPPHRRRTRSQGPPSPPRASSTSPKRQAPPAAASSRKKGRVLGPIIELTDSEEEDDDLDVPMRLAPKPSQDKSSQGSANAVASGSGTRHSDAEDSGSEVELIDYDPEFAAKPFPFDEAFISASQKTPRQQSHPVAGPSRARPPPPTPVKAAESSPQPPATSFRARTAHTPRLLAELDAQTQRAQCAAEEQTAPKAPAPAPVAAVVATPPAASVVPDAPAAPPAPVPPLPRVAPVVVARPVPPAAPVPPVAPVAPIPAAPIAPPVRPAAPVVVAPPPPPPPAPVPPVAPVAPIPEPVLAPAPAPAPVPDPAPPPIPIAAPAPAPATVPVTAARVQPAPAVSEALVQLAITQVLEVLPDIERAYLDRVVRANAPALGADTGERVLGFLVENGTWPRAAGVGDKGTGGAVDVGPAPAPVPPAVAPAIAPPALPVAAARPGVAEPVMPPERAPTQGPAHVAAPIPPPAAAQHPHPAPPAAVPPPPAAAAAAAPEDPEALIHLATAQVRGVLPDIEGAYLERCVRMFMPQHGADTGGAVLGALMERGEWPTEAVGQGAEVHEEKGKGKGRAREDAEEDKEEAGGAKRARIDYESVDRPFVGGMHYTEVALIHLQCAFPYTSKAYLRRVLSEHRGHYAPAYMYLHRLHARLCAPAVWDQGYPKNKTRFDARRKVGLIYGRRDEALEAEVRWVEGVVGGGGGGGGGAGVGAGVGVNAVDKGKGKARAVEEEPEEEAAAEDEDGGIECQCCFSDYPFTQMVQCPEAHLFCTGCVKTYASNQLAASSASLLCMHASGCALPFPISELARALPASLMALYERVAAAKAVEEAGLEGLEGCPFCEWQCVMEVGGEERLFRCGNVGRCGAVSCRGCKKKDHLPKTCEEAEADKHLDGRHAIEEAMTRALMRNCPKCKKGFIKEHGCNKMTCPNCRTMSCYICRKAITGYEHFHQNNPNQRAPVAQGSNAKCLLWDEVETRHAADVKAAAEEATKAYREAHPDVDEAAIKVDIPVAPPPKPPQAPLILPPPLIVPAQHFPNPFPWPGVPPPIMHPIQRPPAPALNPYAGRQNLVMHPLVPQVQPPPPAHPRPRPDPQAQALELHHRQVLALQERERRAREAAVRAARKEAQRERKAERARVQAVVQAQMEAMEAQREYGRRQMALEMQREQALRAAGGMGQGQTFGAQPPVAPKPAKRHRNQPR